MLNTILGKKIDMSQTFVGETKVAVTRIAAGPCIVTQIKNPEKDGYWGVQIGYGDRNLKNVTKPLQGHLKGAIKEKKAPRFLREIRLSVKPEVEVGATFNLADVLKKGDIIAVTGTSKGKGFAGVMKRWDFAGGPKTHGQSNRDRAPGSIGQGTTPGRVRKGKKMAGRMGTDTVTIKNLHVVAVDPEKNEVFISGSIPGPRGNLLIIKRLAHGSLSELEVEIPDVELKAVEPEEEAKTEEVKAEN